MRRAFALVVAGAFVVAACGSDSEQLSEEEFLAAANEICEVGNEEVDQLFADTFAAAGDEATEEELQQFFQDEGGELRDAGAARVCVDAAAGPRRDRALAGSASGHCRRTVGWLPIDGAHVGWRHSEFTLAP